MALKIRELCVKLTASAEALKLGFKLANALISLREAKLRRQRKATK
jgi:hypothetical protein